MLWTTLKRMRDEEDGFTLIELMVVVMILAILIVMGMPTFLGVRARFQDRGAQTDLRNAVLSARILYTDNATFSSATSLPGTGLVSIVPNMCYVAGTAATPSAASGTVACASGVGNGSISVNSTPNAVHGRQALIVAVLLRDPGCDDRDPVRRDHRGELLRGLGHHGDRDGYHAGRRRLVTARLPRSR